MRQLQQREDTEDDLNIMESFSCLTQKQPNAESHLQKSHNCDLPSK